MAVGSKEVIINITKDADDEVKKQIEALRKEAESKRKSNLQPPAPRKAAGIGEEATGTSPPEAAPGAEDSGAESGTESEASSTASAQKKRNLSRRRRKPRQWPRRQLKQRRDPHLSVHRPRGHHMEMALRTWQWTLLWLLLRLIQS